MLKGTLRITRNSRSKNTIVCHRLYFTMAHTMESNLILCGVEADTNGVVWNNAIASARISADLFADSFEMCMDITFDELDDHWKTYNTLTVADGRIRLKPNTKLNVRALVHWVRDCYRLEIDPSTLAFPVAEKIQLIRKYNTHKKWLKDSEAMAKSALPQLFTEKIKWTDWKPTFIGFLNSQPSCWDIPLNYVVRENDEPIIRTNQNFLDDYVDRAPMTGATYTMDSQKVHTFIVKFIAGHSAAEQKILPFKDTFDGRRAFLALRDFYEGVGSNAVSIIAAEKDLRDLFYTGERQPHMWWDEFESRLTNAFAVIDKDAGRIVHTGEAKLRLLNNKIRADFMITMKTHIEMEMIKVPCTMTFQAALANYRNTVNQKYPHDQQTHKKRRIQNTNSNANRYTPRGNGNNNRNNSSSNSTRSNSRSVGRNNNNNNNNGNRNRRNDEWTVIGLNGRQVTVHPTYRLTPMEWNNLPQPVKNQLTEMRNRHRQELDRRRQVAQANTYTHDGNYSLYSGTMHPPPLPPVPQYIVPPPPPPPRDSSIGMISQGGNHRTNHNDDNSSRISSVTMGTSFNPSPYMSVMGGRNAQAQQRSRENGPRGGRISNVISKRTISQFGSKMPEPAPNTVASNEADTNADTCCLGKNFIPLAYTNRSADVYPYTDSYKPLENVPIVTAATAYDHEDGQTYILVVNEALYYGTKMNHSLINPNQVRYHGLDFFDNPVRDKTLYMQADDDVNIPLHYEGTKCLFKSRSPTQNEINNCPHLHITSNIEWDPATVDLRSLYCISSVKKAQQRQAYKVSTGIQFNTLSPVEHSSIESFAYADPTSDEAILSDITPSLVQLKEMCVSAINVQSHHNYVIPSERTFISRERHPQIDAESLSDKWNIGLKRAHATIQVTTQRGVRSAIMPISRRYRADRYENLKRLSGKFSTDTIFSPRLSLHQNTCAQIYSHKCGFSTCYPMKDSKGDRIGQSLHDFSHDFGVPEHLTFDGYSAQVGKNTEFFKAVRKYKIDYHVSSPRRPNENPAEGTIRELKRRFYRVLVRKRVPRRLWDYLMTWICETNNLSVSSSKYANGRTAIEMITGETPDISEYLDFSFYDWVVYRSNAGLGEPELGRWIGVSHKIGQLMSFWVLPISGIPISCVTVQPLTKAEMQLDEYKSQMKLFDEKIVERLSIKNDQIHFAPEMPDWNRLSLDEDDPEFVEDFLKVIDDENIPHADDAIKESINYDNYINMEIGMPRGPDGEVEHARVKRRALDVNGRPMGTASNNPITDTRLYDVEFNDGTIETISANLIAENLLSQVDAEGHRQMMLDEIIDHRCDQHAVIKEDAFYHTKHGVKRRKFTTKGWQLCVTWKDGSTQWIELKDLKNSYPVQLADYAVSNKIDDEPAFAWWVPHTIKKRKIILGRVKSKYWQRTHKYGIRMPKNVDEAYELDKANGNSLWADAIKDEMPKIIRALERHEGTEKELIDRGFKEITGHIIFDVKLGENFRRKARFVADGHKTTTPSSVTYSTVVSRDSVRICLTIAALNNLDVLAGDVEHAYLTAPCREKCWLRAGREFGELQGSILIVKMALYGLKSSGAAFRAFLAERLDDIGFKSSIADPDVWMRSAIKPDGERYYEYILAYVDDLLCISFDPNCAMLQINEKLKFKGNKIEPPEFYLGAKISEKKLNGRKIWTMSSIDYVKAAVKNLEEQLRETNRKLPSRAVKPMVDNYFPELDDTPELPPDQITFFQELIGILRWATEIGRVDILTELSMLSTYQAAPRQGHLEQVFHIFAYLKHKPKLTLYFNTECPNIDTLWFAQNDEPKVFKDQYSDAKEQLPPDYLIPEPLGR